MLADNFDDPAAGRLPRTSAEPANYERGYTDGEYVLYKVNPEYTGTAFATLPGTYANSSLAVDARIIGDAANRELRLYCRIQGGSRLSAYEMRIFPGEGRARLYKVADGTATPISSLIDSSAIRRGNETNRLELSCAGPTISIAVNGTRVAAVGDGTFQQGPMRVASFATGTTVQARIDNLVVTQVAEEAPPPPPAPPRYDGTWKGSSTEGRANDFTVRNDSVVQITVDYRVEGGQCSISGLQTLSVSTPARIENDGFSATVTRDVSIRLSTDQQQYPGTQTIMMTGRFNSPSSASGETEVTVRSDALSCYGSSRAGWTASKS